MSSVTITRAATTATRQAAHTDTAEPALPLGTHLRTDGTCSFCVWGPIHDTVALRIVTPQQRELALTRDAHGYHATVVHDVDADSTYLFVLPDGTALPDPASRFQPDGVHGASRVVTAAFEWQTEIWPTPDLRSMVLYELHIGTFTPEGTFDAAIERLPALRELGVTAVEIMPIAQFPGERNWGYDGVFAFAAQHSYGGPLALKRFVDAAHAAGLHVVLDVVYNHVGPEGNHLPRFGPYFTDVYRTPWGDAMNFDGAGSDHVRRYFIDSALQWIDEFRIDGLRIDAVHAIHDRSARPFLLELAAAVHERAHIRGRSAVLIAESDLGDPRVVRPPRSGGLGLDAQWLDDFHHSLRTLLSGEQAGYYADFGTIGQLARAFRDGYVYSGQYSVFRGRRHGAPGPDIDTHQLVVYAQNHDQIGNRVTGDRLTATQTPAQLRLAAATILLSPYTPMLFMGEEYGETRPFPYFVSHSDPGLIDAVRTGRLEEFESFAWEGAPPDPQAEETFTSAILDWRARARPEGQARLRLHRHLLTLRRTLPSLAADVPATTQLFDAHGNGTGDDAHTGVLVVRRRHDGQSALLVLNFAGTDARVTLSAAAGTWRCVLDTAATLWHGDGTSTPDTLASAGQLALMLHAHSAVLLVHDEL